MKKILIAATVLSLLGGSAALAQPYGYGQDRYAQQDRYDRHNDRYDRGDRNDRANRYDRNDRRDSRSHRWSRGERLPQSYRSSRYAVDYRRHNLRAPPRGYRWQQVDNNYVLAAIATGIISQVIYGR